MLAMLVMKFVKLEWNHIQTGMGSDSPYAMEVEGHILQVGRVQLKEKLFKGIAQCLLIAGLVEGVDDANLVIEEALLCEVVFHSLHVGPSICGRGQDLSYTKLYCTT